MKQAILVWSFRQNIFLASLLQKSSILTHGGAAVTAPSNYLANEYLNVGSVFVTTMYHIKLGLRYGGNINSNSSHSCQN